MVAFDLWKEAFVFGVIYAVIITIPCVIAGIMGVKMINQLGTYPSKTPFIQMSIFFKLVLLEIVTFTLLVGFYHVFTPA
jgi:hypothetical protein